MVVELCMKDAKPVTTVQVCIATQKKIFLTESGTSAKQTKTGILKGYSSVSLIHGLTHRDIK